MPDFDALRSAEQDLWHSLGLDPIEHRLALPTLGVTVRVQEIGTGDPVLFVHGGSSWGTSWANLVASLTDFRCILLDRPGTGCSEPVEPSVGTPHDLTDLADALIPGVLDALRLPQAHLVATSLGGWFALHSALHAPDRISTGAIIGWTGGAPVARLPFSLRVANLPVIGDVLGRLPASPASVRAIFRSLGEASAVRNGHVTPEAVAAFVALLNHTDTLTHDIHLSRLFFNSPGSGANPVLFGAEERRAIATPLTFIWGEADPFGGGDIAREFVQPFSDATLHLLAGAGHVPWFDEPDRLPELVRGALTI